MSDNLILAKDTAIRTAKIYKASTVLKKPISDATHTLSEISILMLIELLNSNLMNTFFHNSSKKNQF